MAKDLTSELYDMMQEKIVNEDILSTELRDIYPVIIDTLRQLPDLVMLGYKREQIDPNKRFKIEMDDLIRKKGQNSKKPPEEIIDFSVDLNETKVDILRCYFIISPELISNSAKETALTNTKYRISEVSDSLDVAFDSDLKTEILNRKDEYDSKREDDRDLDLVLETPLLVPRLVNSQYYLLDGRKLFSAFYMKRVGQWRNVNNDDKPNKLEVTNIMPRPYKGDDELYSYIYIDDDEIIRYEFLGLKVNPFAMLDNNIRIHEVFPEFFETKKKPNCKEGEILKNTYDLWKKKEKRKFNKEKQKHLDDEELKDYKYKTLEDVNPREVTDAINNVLIPDDRDVVFDIHKSLRKFLKIEILERIPNFRNSRRAKADIVKSRININAELINMTLKKRKQFSSTVADSVNSVDIYKQFSYISELRSGSQIGDGPRRFRPNQLGIVDPIATSTTTMYCAPISK